jgi:hypothetical protein
MPLSADFNLDAVSAFVTDHTRSAIRAWQNGVPQDETALMNHLTGQLSRTSCGCDVGLKSPLIVQPKVFELHRKGLKSSDRHGADFAVTISFEPSKYTKTALFQLKAGTGYRARLELDQLDDMLADTRAASRAFVLYVDEDRIGVRIKSAKEVRAAFHSNKKKSQTFDTTGWQSGNEWLLDWMRCKVGPESNLKETNPIEATLASMEHRSKLSGKRQSRLPANAWLVHVFAPPTVDYDNTAFAKYFKEWRKRSKS